MINLFHYSNSSLLDLNPNFYSVLEKLYPPVLGKTHGLWVSVEDAWEKWCRAENYNIPALSHKHHIILKSTSNILLLDSPSKIYTFTDEYALQSHKCNAKGCVNAIDWIKVKSQFQGIIISPYQWECRLDLKTLWYYGWDCASGCIWDCNAIDKIVLEDNKNDL